MLLVHTAFAKYLFNNEVGEFIQVLKNANKTNEFSFLSHSEPKIGEPLTIQVNRRKKMITDTVTSFFDVEVNQTTLEHTDITLAYNHSKDSCSGERCTLHKRSNHSMRSFPQHWRSDRFLMERICTHGIGHPDPDDINLDKDARMVHGCDGCCEGAY